MNEYFVSFNDWVIFYCVALGLFCMHSLVDIHLGCIYLLAILNNAAVLVLSSLSKYRKNRLILAQVLVYRLTPLLLIVVRETMTAVVCARGHSWLRNIGQAITHEVMTPWSTSSSWCPSPKVSGTSRIAWPYEDKAFSTYKFRSYI